MSLSLFLQAGVVPNGTRLPGNSQALVAFIAQYVLIAGGQNFNGINFGSVTPSADNRDKPWWRTDSSGNPLGMYSWNGTAWVTTNFSLPFGPSATRPLNPANYSIYFDTTINVPLIYERGAWRTLSGSPGDIKFVKAATIAAAIAQNPGWIQDTDSIARVIGGAGTAAGVGDHAYAATVGTENVTLGLNQIPEHNHTFTVNNGHADGNTTNSPDQGVDFHGSAGTAGTTDRTTTNAGSGEPVNLLQPTIYYWTLLKQ